MMKKIINYINICHIALNKLIFIYISEFGIIITVGPSGHIGPDERMSMCS